jgi:hypothetical protein
MQSNSGGDLAKSRGSGQETGLSEGIEVTLISKREIEIAAKVAGPPVRQTWAFADPSGLVTTGYDPANNHPETSVYL